MIDEGRYIGIIQSAGIETDPYDPDGLVLCFVVQLPGGETVEPHHTTTGEYARITKQIVESFGLDWPQGIEQIGSVVGREVPITVKHKLTKKGESYVRAYIATPRKGEVADAATIKRNLAKLAGEVPDDDNVPF